MTRDSKRHLSRRVENESCVAKPQKSSHNRFEISWDKMMIWPRSKAHWSVRLWSYSRWGQCTAKQGLLDKSCTWRKRWLKRESDQSRLENKKALLRILQPKKSRWSSLMLSLEKFQRGCLHRIWSHRWQWTASAKDPVKHLKHLSQYLAVFFESVSKLHRCARIARKHYIHSFTFSELQSLRQPHLKSRLHQSWQQGTLQQSRRKRALTSVGRTNEALIIWQVLSCLQGKRNPSSHWQSCHPVRSIIENHEECRYLLYLSLNIHTCSIYIKAI